MDVGLCLIGRLIIMIFCCEGAKWNGTQMAQAGRVIVFFVTFLYRKVTKRIANSEGSARILQATRGYGGFV
jgi:hypothetical protein